MSTSWSGRLVGAVGAAAVALAATACSTAEVAPAAGPTEITLLTDDGPNTLQRVESVVAAFEAKNPDITVKASTRPGGAVGRNLLQTKLAAGEAEDVLWFDSGSLMTRPLDPARNFVDLAGSPAVANVEPSFLPAVTVDGKTYGAPWGDAKAGGILYNKKVYRDLGLEVPATWAQFASNNAAVKAAGINPVIGAFADRWTTQVLVLGDFHNVLASSKDWAARYTDNEVTYATDPVALRGFEKTAEVADRGWLNRDAAFMTEAQAMAALASGAGAHHPTLTDSIARLSPDQAKDIGFFGVPGDDASAAGGTTLWMPGGQYIPRASRHVEAAKRFVAFVASPEGVAASHAAVTPSGPSFVSGAPLPDDAVPVAEEVQRYVDRRSYAPALEFSSPVKGPSLAQITTAVMSGQTSARAAAEQYDVDVAEQARLLDLPGW